MNIWLPHIPKNGGTSIFYSLENFCPYQRTDFIGHDTSFKNKVKTWERRTFTNPTTNDIITTRHGNPLTNEMKDWVKILIVRDPIDRAISTYNYDTFKVTQQTKYPHNNIDVNTWLEFNILMRWTHLNFLNHIQMSAKDPLIKQFTLTNIFDVFDYIIDLTEINKVYSLIEDIFLKRKITWTLHNSTEQNLKKIKHTILYKKDLTKDQLEKIKNSNNVKYDWEFYELWKVKNQLFK